MDGNCLTLNRNVRDITGEQSRRCISINQSCHQRRLVLLSLKTPKVTQCSIMRKSPTEANRSFPLYQLSLLTRVVLVRGCPIPPVSYAGKKHLSAEKATGQDHRLSSRGPIDFSLMLAKAWTCDDLLKIYHSLGL